MPAPRLERPTENTTTTFDAMGAPTQQQASLPPASRVIPPISSPLVGRNDGVAVYDISAATVYLPNGERLEAHSGLGYMVDNPRYADRKNSGPTPPDTYNLVRLEGRFHGVEALRLVPADGNNKYGRDGLLTHTYLLRGRPAESNGCVAFKDYDRFLAAFKRGDVRRLVVVASLSSPTGISPRLSAERVAPHRVGSGRPCAPRFDTPDSFGPARLCKGETFRVTDAGTLRDRGDEPAWRRSRMWRNARAWRSRRCRRCSSNRSAPK